MAKFKYGMQNILNIKEKLETQARNEFAEARLHLDEEEEKMQLLIDRRTFYEAEGRSMRENAINIQDLIDNQYAVDRMDEYIADQQLNIDEAEKLLERARIKLQEAMQETKIHAKLREKAFEEFKKELIAQESKEVDELTSYTYGRKVLNNG